MLVSMAGADVSHKPGDIVEFHEEAAIAQIACGNAAPIVEPEVEIAVNPKAKQRERR